MIRRLVVTAAAAVVVLASAVPLVASKPKVKQPSSHPAGMLIGSSGIGTVCHVDGQWWTMNHVAEQDNVLQWRSGSFVARATVKYRDTKHDVKRVEVPNAPPMAWLEHSDRELVSGDPITLYGWMPVRGAVVAHGWFFIEDDDGDLFVDVIAWPGMSGSCAVDDATGGFIGLVGGVSKPTTKSGDSSSYRPAAYVVRLEDR